ncbi:MAG: 2TM domain-containing protein, partial [Bacteroidota bacterium]
MHDEDIYEAAHKKVQAKKGFLYHFAAFASVIGLLYAIFYFEGGGYLPVVIVGLSWGIGIAIHYLKTFGTEHLDFLGISPNWE